MSDRGMVEVDQPCEIKMPTIREQLLSRKRSLALQTEEVDAAIAVLDKNPSFEEVHNALNKLNVRGLLR